MQLWEDLRRLSDEIDEEETIVQRGEEAAEEALHRVSRSVPHERLPRQEREIATEAFVKGSFEAVLQLHEEILAAKEQTLTALKEENALLKEALYRIQELYDEEHTTLKTLERQLARTQEELELTRRKYRLMWEKAIENYENDGGRS